MPPHGLVRINIKIKFIVNNCNYLSHALFHLLNILTYNTLKIHTHRDLVVICLISNNIFLLCSTPPCPYVFAMYLIEPSV